MNDQPQNVEPKTEIETEPSHEISLPSEPLKDTTAIPESLAIAAKPKSHKRHILIGAAIVLTLVFLSAAVLGYTNRTKHVSKTVTTASVKVSPVVKQTPATGTVFYDTPKQLSNLNFIRDLAGMYGTSCSTPNMTNCPLTVTADQILYNQIGVTAAGQQIIIVSNTSDVAGVQYVALSQGNGSYVLLINETFSKTDPNYDTQVALLKKSVSSTVTVDTTTSLAALTFPRQVTVGGQSIGIQSIGMSDAVYLATGYLINGLSDIRGSYLKSTIPPSNMTKLGVQNGITFYEITVPNSSTTTYRVREIYGVIKGVYASSYTINEPLAAQSAPSVSWKIGNQISPTSYTYSAGGCGSPTGFVVATTIPADQLTVAGTTPNGELIYQLATNNKLFTAYYTDYGTGSGLSDASSKNLSADQYQAAHGVVFTKNGLGEYVAYQRNDFSSGGGCGKPVIYLYPQKTTKVSVSVGAHVTTSAPQYNRNGWQNIVAQPNGQLSYLGKSYNSLFWEGTGFGMYPLITFGTIVQKDKVVSTIHEQLQQQGLNNQEITDFLAYWQPKLPTTPYTRLTWLDTAQMNSLAPLQISPKPATMIRVFLDFDGLDTPRPITPQTFSAPLRKGFTVVEWGGLLRNHK